MSYRIEQKIPIRSEDANLFRAEFGSQLQQLFPPRTVTSLYFDNSDNQCFADSEEGVLPRKKVRVRWYGGQANKLLLEKKFSSEEGRYKLSNSITESEFSKFQLSGIFDSDYGKLYPRLIVQYRREYYRLGSVRLTIDSDIRYFTVHGKIPFRDDYFVVEVKAPIGVSDYYLNSILPLQRSRFSKYSRGLLAINS